MDDFEARRLDSPELAEQVRSVSGEERWPPASWDLRSLTLAAMYYSPDLDVARAQWGSAQAGRITAGERPNPTGTVLMGYNSTSPTSEVTPWIPEAAIEIPLEIAGKRGYRIAQARQMSEAARLNILAAAWDVRGRLRRAFLDLFSARETERLLKLRLADEEENLKILEAQWAAGEASLYDLTQARIAHDNARLAQLEASGQSRRAIVALAGAIGLPEQALDGVRFSFDALLDPKADLPSGEIRRRALLGRADILAALAQYDAAQSVLRLEIARQYPDISLGPGWQLDQTDNKWTLGLSLLLPLLSRNKGPIAEAEARRQECAARFLALQAKVIEEIDGAVAFCGSAIEKAKTAEALLANLLKQEAAAKIRYDIGEISKSELLGIRLEIFAGSLARLEAVVKAQQAVGQLENAIQGPLDLADRIVESPPRKK